jgi:hypothetical protein
MCFFIAFISLIFALIATAYVMQVKSRCAPTLDLSSSSGAKKSERASAQRRKL